MLGLNTLLLVVIIFILLKIDSNIVGIIMRNYE